MVDEYRADKEYVARSIREKALVNFLIEEEKRMFEYMKKEAKNESEREYYKGEANGIRSAIAALQADEKRIREWPALEKHFRECMKEEKGCKRDGKLAYA